MNSKNKEIYKVIMQIAENNDEIFYKAKQPDWEDEDPDTLEQEKRIKFLKGQKDISKSHDYVEAAMHGAHTANSESDQFKFEHNGKRYIYRNLDHAMQAYSDALHAHHYAHGLMDLDPENEEHQRHINNTSQSISETFLPFNEAMIKHNNNLFDNQYRSNPAFRQHADSLANHYGADMERVKANVFTDIINRNQMFKSSKVFGALADNYGQDMAKQARQKINKENLTHESPLGLILNGGAARQTTRIEDIK